MLTRMLTLVERFNREIVGLEIPTSPKKLSPERAKARHEQFIEEDNEFLEIDSLEDQADALMDGIYFRLGALVEMGILPGPVFDAIHEANMLKKRGTIPRRQHSTGFDAVKPEGWKPPNLMPYLIISKSDVDTLLIRASDKMDELTGPQGGRVDVKA